MTFALLCVGSFLSKANAADETNHEAILHTLRRFPGPLVTGAAAATTAAQVARASAADVELVIDDGPSQFAQFFRRQYGVYPSEMLRQRRDTLAG